MFRFSIRDVLWLTVVVGMAIVLHREWAARVEMEQRLEESHRELKMALAKQNKLQREFDQLATKRGLADVLLRMLGAPYARPSLSPPLRLSESDELPSGHQLYFPPDPNAL